MSKATLTTVMVVLKVAVAFLNGFAGIVAAYPGPELPALARLGAAAIVGGCGAVLLMTQPPGAGEFNKKQVDAIARRLLELRAQEAPRG